MRRIDADALQKEYMHEHDGKRLMLIDVAPTIEPEPHWIPVTERLPGKSGNYLVTWEAVKGCTTTVQMMHFYQYLGGFGDAVKHILAWMPLPNPWKVSNERK